MMRLFSCISLLTLTGLLGTSHGTGDIYAPPNTFGVANLTLTSSSISHNFYIVDSAYFHPFGNCTINFSGPAGSAPPVALGVFQPCDPPTYQYKLVAWHGPLTFTLETSHTFQGATYTDNKATLIRAATFDFEYSGPDAASNVTGSPSLGGNSSNVLSADPGSVGSTTVEGDSITIDAESQTVTIGFVAALTANTNITLAPKGFKGDVLAPKKDNGGV